MLIFGNIALRVARGLPTCIRHKSLGVRVNFNRKTRMLLRDFSAKRRSVLVVMLFSKTF